MSIYLMKTNYLFYHLKYYLTSEDIMKRHNSRIFTILVLFNLDMNNIDLSQIEVEALKEVKEDVKKLILDDEYQVEINYEFSDLIIDKVISEYNNIIEIIKDSLVNWSIDRLSYVDRAIVVSATAEMLIKDAPKEVIINEYLEITKEYSAVADEKQVRFNNKVLDGIAKKLYE